MAKNRARMLVGRTGPSSDFRQGGLPPGDVGAVGEALDNHRLPGGPGDRPPSPVQQLFEPETPSSSRSVQEAGDSFRRHGAGEEEALGLVAMLAGEE